MVFFKNKEHKKGKSDLAKYLASHKNSFFRHKLIKSRLILVISIGVPAASIFTSSIPSFASCLLSFIALLQIIAGVVRHIDDKNPNKYYSCHKDNYEFDTILVEELKIEEHLVKFSSLLPSIIEENYGFTLLDNKSLVSDSAFVSSNFNNKLLLAENIRVTIDLEHSEPFISNNKKLQKNQLLYLNTKVQKQEHRTINESKICLDSSIKEFIEAINGDGSVRLSKVGYFDGLVTNEAFRSKVVEVRKNSNALEPTTIIDLSSNFPALEAENGLFRLKQQPISGISRHVGITTIALTSDNQILFFRQANNNLIGGDLLVASGSGSADYEDIKLSKNLTNLKSIISFSMARELAEESGLLQNTSKKERSDLISSMAEKTLITGFFRWVNRCGKPEFIGVSRIDRLASEITGDNHEVISKEEDNLSFRREISSLSDFGLLLEKCKIKDEKLNLSFYVALKRLDEISSYEDSDLEEEKVIFNKLDNLLFPKNI